MIDQSIPMAFEFFTDQFKDEPEDTTEVRVYDTLMKDFNDWRIENHRSTLTSSAFGSQMKQVHCVNKRKYSRGVQYSISIQDFWREIGERFGYG
jgi:hypothetical protein